MHHTLAAAGFDIVQPFDGALLDSERRAGLLVGNTRALWPKFLAARPPGEHPFDRFVESLIDPVVPPGARVLYGHRQYDGAWPPLQQIAVEAGLGSLAETHLVIHPIYGPWFALRAAIVMPGEPPPPAARVNACTCGEPCRAALARATATMHWRDWVAVRDACPVGRPYRYTDDQIEFHYGLLRTPPG
jgi:methylmalonic aciduria homocystinuria type C protein